MSGRGLRTGELADRAGANVQTLRFHERRGCWPPRPAAPPQPEHPEGTVRLLRTIKAVQRLGFTLT